MNDHEQQHEGDHGREDDRKVEGTCHPLSSPEATVLSGGHIGLDSLARYARLRLTSLEERKRAGSRLDLDVAISEVRAFLSLIEPAQEIERNARSPSPSPRLGGA